jgi:hypothetical protein
VSEYVCVRERAHAHARMGVMSTYTQGAICTPGARCRVRELRMGSCEVTRVSSVVASAIWFCCCQLVCVFELLCSILGAPIHTHSRSSVVDSNTRARAHTHTHKFTHTHTIYMHISTACRHSAERSSTTLVLTLLGGGVFGLVCASVEEWRDYACALACMTEKCTGKGEG